MPFGTERVVLLDPSEWLKSIDLKANEEVMIRRQISAMYMAAFNFWASAEYYIRGLEGNGVSKQPDDFREQDFDKVAIHLKKFREMQYLSVSRNACDHRLKNPASGVMFTPNSSKEDDILIDNSRLNRCYTCLQELVDAIKNEYMEDRT